MIKIKPDERHGFDLKAYEGDGSLALRIEPCRGGTFLQIGAEGYGEMAAVEGEGFPILLEFYDGKLQLRVYADINNEEPTHVIDMSGALESNRTKE